MSRPSDGLEKFLELPKLEGVRQRVYRVGLELEGAWLKLPRGTNVQHDGSVRINSEDVLACGVDPNTLTSSSFHPGEIASPPLEVKTFPTWLQTYYPQVTNRTCGFHVHMSFRTGFLYQKLMSPSYPATVVEYMRRWAERERFASSHAIWPRLRGENEYCQHKFFAEAQIGVTRKDYDRSRPGHRYTVIAYPYAQHSTIECRLLPMFGDAGQATRAVAELLNITNGFLLASARREARVSAEVKADDDCIMEEIRVRV